MYPLRVFATLGLAAVSVASEAVAVPSGQYAASVQIPATYVYPVMGPRVSSNYGVRKHPVRKITRHHHGIDLAAPAGSPIRTISGGQVIFADPWGGYGKFVVVMHKDGMTSHYGHMEKILVKTGQSVRAGDIIGSVGSTGISTGPHLHFEIRINGKTQNPEKLLPGLAAESNG